MRQKMRYFLLFVGLLLSVSIGAQTVKWRDIYTVKKKDTIFGIANKYGLSLPELMDARFRSMPLMRLTVSLSGDTISDQSIVVFALLLTK